MNTELENLCNEIEDIANQIKNTPIPNNATTYAAYNWTFPPLNNKQIVSPLFQISEALKKTKKEKILESEKNLIDGCLGVIQEFKAHVLPNIANNPGNIHVGYVAYSSLLDFLRTSLQPIIGFQNIPNRQYIPYQIGKKINKLKDSLEQHLKDEKIISGKLSIIDKANSAVANLPTTIKKLDEVESRGEEIIELRGKIINEQERMKEDAEAIIKEMEKKANEAEELLKRCGSAAAAATSIELGDAFDRRANELNRSVKWWVIGLAFSLIAGALFGWYRFEELSKLLSGNNIEQGVILTNLVLSVLGLGLPGWFAWLATKQIGQRFRLSEDYAFKASVAKAYEGYRRESQQFDPATTQRLFNAALTQLEEEPLRHIENTTHGSPLQESGMAKAITNLIKKDTPLPPSSP